MDNRLSSTSYDGMANSLDAMTTSPTPVAYTSSSTSSDILSGLTSNINNVLENRYIRVFIFVVAAVYAGYTLTPVPKQLNNLFAKSNFFKYMILFFVSISLLHPLDNTKLTICLIIPVLVLGFFNVLRKNESKPKSESTSTESETSSDVKKHERKHERKHEGTHERKHSKSDSCSPSVSSDKKSMVAHKKASHASHAGKAGKAGKAGHADKIGKASHADKKGKLGSKRGSKEGRKLGSPKHGSKEGRKLGSPKGVAVGAEHFFI
jgi:hypothetical protein